MLYDKDQIRLEKIAAERAAEQEKIKAQLAEINRKKRAAESQLKAVSKHENWHSRILALPMREVDLTGEDGPAFYYLKQLSAKEYFGSISAVAADEENRTIAVLEYAAVKANHAEWTRRGEAIHYEKQKQKYQEECLSFAQWQAENPDKTGWRDKPATRLQYFLMWRTAQRLNIQTPVNIKRGEAYDWLIERDANLRFNVGVAKPTAIDDATATSAPAGNHND